MTPEIESQTIAQIKQRFAMACAALNSLGWCEGEDGVWRKSEPAPDANGWIPWSGGKCPVAKGEPVDVQYRNGEIKLSVPANVLLLGCDWDASDAFWLDEGLEADIIAYRIHKPEPAPEKPQAKWHNPEGIPEAPEGWRFTVEGEAESHKGDKKYYNHSEWVLDEGSPYIEWTYIVPASTPLPGEKPAIKVTTPVDIACPPGGPKDEPLPVPDGWLELGDEEKDGRWKRGAKWANSESCDWEYSPVSLNDDMGAFAHHKNRIIVPIVAKEWVPLEAADVPVGSVLRWASGQVGWVNIDYVAADGLWVPCEREAVLWTWARLAEKVQISRDGGKSWSACKKPAK